MNYAMADELIESNFVDILKLKRVDRSIRKREHYLPAEKVRESLDKTLRGSSCDAGSPFNAPHIGLRKNEALMLKWSALEHVYDVECLVIRDTKNKRPHYIPVTNQIHQILDKARHDTDFIFPSSQRKNMPITEVRPTLGRLSKSINFEFKCHDLRRTFATRAAEVGIDYLMIKRMLNHKSNDITAQYIQWDSRQNLQAMRTSLERVCY